MFHVVLYQPEIPPNTGNVIRLCANTGAELHLIHPLGFDLSDAQLKRAGLDYHEYARIHEYQSLDEFLANVAPARLFALSSRGRRWFHQTSFQAGDAFLFGQETAGLPAEVVSRLPAEALLRLPMQAGSRSLNLSNAVAVTVFEAWRQQIFAGAI